MEIYIFRGVRSLILALIMFFALRVFGFSPAQSALGASVPFVLGTVDVMAATAFSLTGCVFILAIAVALFPAQYRMLKSLAATGMDQAAVGVQNTGSNASPSDSASNKK